MPIRVTKFQTKDGKEFDNQADAIAHEHCLLAAEVIKEEYHASLNANRADSLLISVLSNPIPFRNALTKLIRQNQIRDEEES